MNKLQQIILNVIEEMDWGGVYGSMSGPSVDVDNQLNNTDSYATGSNIIPNIIPNNKFPMQKRTFPELITQRKNKKNGKQKQKQRKSVRKTNL